MRELNNQMWKTSFLGKLALILAIGVKVVGAAAETDTYRAALHEAGWDLEASVFACQLVQTVPGFGEITFIHEAGEAPRLRFVGDIDPANVTSMRLLSMPAPWQQRQVPEVLMSALEARQARVLEFGSEVAETAMRQLLSGRVPTLVAALRAPAGLRVEVGVSPINFRSAHRDYRSCQADLLPVNFAQVGNSTIFWKSGARELSSADRALLDNIALYSATDPKVIGFEIDSFTDTAGERRDNLLLSEERAFMVTNYLISKGVDPESIATRAHGEREEYLVIDPERSAADRDRNRRVNIVMRRSP